MIDLEKLKNFDIKSIDLKNIDAGKIIATLMEKKDLLAQVIVVVLSVIILFSLLGGYHSQGQELRQEESLLKEKSEVIASYEKVQTQTKAFMKTIPKALDEDLFSSEVTDYAEKNNIAIVAFTPGLKKTDPLTEMVTARLTVRTAHYKDLLLFIKSLEDSPYGLRIDSCVLTVQAGSSRQVQGSEKKTSSIEGQLEISSVSLKK